MKALATINAEKLERVAERHSWVEHDLLDYWGFDAGGWSGTFYDPYKTSRNNWKLSGMRLNRYDIKEAVKEAMKEE